LKVFASHESERWLFRLSFAVAAINFSRMIKPQRARANRRNRCINWTLVLAMLLAWGFPTSFVHSAEEAVPVKTSEFLRFVKTGSSEGHVDTAIATYRHPDGTSVTLVAAIHIADGEYYRQLQKTFEQFDAVLYEMVKPKTPVPTNAPSSGHPVRLMQNGMKSLLALEFQLDGIDYSPTNFVHADMDAEMFSRLQKDKGESIFGLILRAALEEQNQRSASQNPWEGMQVLLALMSKDSAHKLKFIFAGQLEQTESMMSGLDQGPDGQGSVLLSGRNQVAMDVLAEQIGKGKRNLAIFYGAGHMPDLAKRLTQSGFKKSAEQWIVAWDIQPRKAPK
jgi:hypothetical protein